MKICFDLNNSQNLYIEDYLHLVRTTDNAFFCANFAKSPREPSLTAAMFKVDGE